MLTKTFKFTLPDDPAPWRVRVHDRIKTQDRQIVIERDGETLFEDIHTTSVEDVAKARSFHIDTQNIEVQLGAISLMAYGLVVRKDGDIVWRSHDKPFRKPGAFDAGMTKLEEKTEQWEAEAAREPTPEARARAERQAALRPSIYVDIGFGIVFFFVAREFGLITAALTGAGATLLLFAINPFVKWDLLGGFAAFGAVMALISAGLAWGFQDDLAIKLRGTIMASIGAGCALFDAVVLKGGYLGQRLALYMEGLGRLNPRRASFALAGATLTIMAIDTPLAFILTTDQWIWYNAFLDSLIAIPIIIGAMLFARERDRPS